MKNKKYSAWFLGPHGENEDMLLNAMDSSLRDHCHWRRNFYTQDPAFISESEKQSPEFLASYAAFKDALETLNLRMKGSAPFFSPRYAGHMISDPSIPAITGHLVGALYNNNNTIEELAPVTMQLEREVLQKLVKMVKYPDTAWGYFTSGGSLANFQCLWRARDVRFYPFTLAMAYTQAKKSLKDKIGRATHTRLGSIGELIENDLLRFLTVEDVTTLINQVISMDEDYEIFHYARSFSVYSLGFSGFVDKGRECLKDRFPTSFRWLVNKAIHYSIDKSLSFLGVGNRDIVPVDWDSNRSLDLGHVENLLESIYNDGGMAMALVGIFGTTEIGSLDNFSDIARLRQQRKERRKGDFWLHADCAWGGYFLSLLDGQDVSENDENGLKSWIFELLHQEFQDLPETNWKIHLEAWALRFYSSAKSIAESDSITIDPHKAGYIPYAAGVTLFKNYIVREVAPFSFPVLNARYRSLTSLQEKIWNIPYMALYTIEGSRPCTGAVATWLMHTSIPLDRDNHGLLIGKSVTNAILFQEYLNQRQITDKDFAIRFIFLADIPLSGIACFTLQIAYDGEILPLKLTNRILKEMYDISVISPELKLHYANFFLTKTTLSSKMYYKEIKSVLGKSLIPGNIFLEKDDSIQPWRDDDKLVILRNVFMNPFSEQSDAKRNYHFFLDDCAVYIRDIALAATKKIMNMNPLPEDKQALPGSVGIIEDNEEWCSLIENQLKASFDTSVVKSHFYDEGAKLLKKETVSVAVLGGRLGISHSKEKIHVLHDLVKVKHVKGAILFTHVDYEEIRQDLEDVSELRPDFRIFYLKQPVQQKENTQFLLNRLSELVWQIFQ
jgi:glutamate/tyrosine decarboxylase-like PLP-dependent enzyme